MFVAMPMDELLELIQDKIFKGIEQFRIKPLPIPNDELLNVEETCALLHISKVTLHKWKKKKIIRCYRIGRKIFFKKHELINAFH